MSKMQFWGFFSLPCSPLPQRPSSPTPATVLPDAAENKTFPPIRKERIMNMGNNMNINNQPEPESFRVTIDPFYLEEHFPNAKPEHVIYDPPFLRIPGDVIDIIQENEEDPLFTTGTLNRIVRVTIPGVGITIPFQRSVDIFRNPDGSPNYIELDFDEALDFLGINNNNLNHNLEGGRRAPRRKRATRRRRTTRRRRATRATRRRRATRSRR
jgi:hypothetical protein